MNRTTVAPTGSFAPRAAATIILLLTLAMASVCSRRALASEASSDLSDSIPEVLVTAQRRAQRLQDVPMSVTAISAEDINRSGARDFNDLLLSVPGVSYAGTQLGLSHFSIRGISTTAANPTVGIFLDDVSLATIGTAFSGAMQPMPMDLERIEVVKGPQGTLYGGSAMGGAIKYVTRKPALNEFSVGAGGAFASVAHGGLTYGGESFINLPLVDDHLAVRMSGSYRLDAGYIDNIKNSEVQVWTASASLPPAQFQPVSYPSQSRFSRDDYNSLSTTVARAAVLYRPVDSLTVLPTATIQRNYQPNPDEFFTNLPEFQNTNRFNQPEHDDFNIYSLQITASLPAVTLTSLTGYVDRHLDLQEDFSLYIGIVTPALLSTNSYNVSSTSTNTFSQEFRATSSAADSRLKWTVGLYVSNQRDYYAQAIDTIGAGTFFGTGTDITFAIDTLTHTRQKALFGDMTFSPGARWSFSTGLRWFDIRQRIDGGGDGIYNGGRTAVTDRRSDDDGVTPRFSASYQVAKDHMVYASAAKGFRPGGPNALGTNSPECGPSLAQLGLQRTPDSYRSDSLWSYEVGVKNEFPAIRGILTAAVFHTDWKKIQQSITLASCAMRYVGNVGAARVDGAELSAEFPVARHLRIGGTIAYTQTKVTQSAVGVDAQVGQELLATPKSMDSVHGEYRRAFGGDWFGGLRTEYDYHGANLRQFPPLQAVTYPNGMTGEIPDATQVQAAYHVVNMSAFWGNAKYQYRLFADNVLDAAPYLDYRRVPGFTGATTLRPRTVGVRFNASF